MTTSMLTTKPSFGNVKVESEAKTINTLAILSSSIAHELKNNLAAISFCAELSLMDIKKKAKAANYVLDNLQLQIKSAVTGKLSNDNFRICSVTKSIKEVLEQYPFQNNEHCLISVKATKDFKYTGNKELTNHILYNLIKNSLHAIKNAGKGKIIIKLELGKKFNKLVFRDTAAGIAKGFLPKIFELFASKGGTGVGLAYCKEVMKSYDGDITCKSTEGKYTKFTLWFPLS